MDLEVEKPTTLQATISRYQVYLSQTNAESVQKPRDSKALAKQRGVGKY
jgi:hypothetical protein